MKNSIKLSLLSAALLAVTGCTSVYELHRDAKNQNQATSTVADQLLSQAAPKENAVAGPIITDLPYVDTRPIRTAARYPLTFKQQVTFNEPAGIPIQVLAGRFEALTGIRMMYQAELSEGVVDIGAAPGQRVAGGTLDLGLPSLDAMLGGAPAAGATAPRSNVSISYSGEVPGLLQAIAGSLGASFEYDETSRTVLFYRYKQIAVRIPASIAEAKSSSKMGVQDSGAANASIGGAMNAAQLESSYMVETSVWDDLDKSLKGLLSDSEGTYTINRAAGLVVMRDRPDRIEAARSYLDSVADILLKQVSVQVTIYRVSVNNSDERAFDVKAAFANTLGHYGITGAFGGALTDSDNFTITVPENDASGVPQRWGGSSLVVQALNTLGDTSVVQNTTLVTANNRPANFKGVTRDSYLASMANNYAGGGNNNGAYSTGPTLTPGMIETGLNLYLLPQVQSDGKLLKLLVTLSRSSLERMDSAGNDQASIQLPHTSAWEFDRELWLRSGQTLVITGFDETGAGQTTRSPMDKSFWFLGGSKASKKNRSLLVVTMRPVVTDIRSSI